MQLIRTVVLATSMLALAAGARADEEKVPLDKLPKSISNSVKKRFPKAEMLEAAKETADGKTEYEVSIKDGGRKIDVMLTPAGAITLIEQEITAKELPATVAKAVEAKYPRAKHKVMEALIKVADGKESLDCYELLIETADKKTLEIVLAPDGTIKKTEDKTAEKKDKD